MKKCFTKQKLKTILAQKKLAMNINPVAHMDEI